MYGLISGLLLDGFDTLVLQSIQLGPGVGGYRPGALFGLLDRVAQIKPGIRPGSGRERVPGCWWQLPAAAMALSRRGAWPRAADLARGLLLGANGGIPWHKGLCP